MSTELNKLMELFETELSLDISSYCQCKEDLSGTNQSSLVTAAAIVKRANILEKYEFDELSGIRDDLSQIGYTSWFENGVLVVLGHIERDLGNVRFVKEDNPLGDNRIEGVKPTNTLLATLHYSLGECRTKEHRIDSLAGLCDVYAFSDSEDMVYVEGPCWCDYTYFATVPKCALRHLYIIRESKRSQQITDNLTWFTDYTQFIQDVRRYKCLTGTSDTLEWINKFLTKYPNDDAFNDVSDVYQVVSRLTEHGFAVYSEDKSTSPLYVLVDRAVESMCPALIKPIFACDVGDKVQLDAESLSKRARSRKVFRHVYVRAAVQALDCFALSGDRSKLPLPERHVCAGSVESVFTDAVNKLTCLELKDVNTMKLVSPVFVAAECINVDVGETSPNCVVDISTLERLDECLSTLKNNHLGTAESDEAVQELSKSLNKRLRNNITDLDWSRTDLLTHVIRCYLNLNNQGVCYYSEVMEAWVVEGDYYAELDNIIQCPAYCIF